MNEEDVSPPVTTPGKASALWTEIVTSTTRHDSRDRTAEEVMRLSSDPLLLHRYLQKSSTTLSMPPAVTTVSAGAWLNPPKSVLSRNAGNRSVTYGLRESLAEPSLEPKPFVATDCDIASAIEYDIASLHTVPQETGETSRISPLLSLLLAGSVAAVSAYFLGLLI